MSARRKKNSSRTWRAILSGREALQRGLIKRVGNGTSIDVCKDPWIPDNLDHQPLGWKLSPSAQKVRDLMSVEGTGWNVNAV